MKSKDLDLWHVINEDDFQPIQNNPKTKLDEVVPFEKQNDDLKKRLAKNNEAKMIIYNALPRKEYEIIFMKSLALKAKKESSDEESSTFGSEDEKYAMAVKDFKKFFKIRGSVLDAETRIILSENVRNHRETRTNRLLSEVLRAIAVRKMMKRLKTKRVSWLKHLARYILNPLTLVMKTLQ
ncbi:hypothetical protein Tco_1292602 [Tanacetum coccineum]